VYNFAITVIIAPSVTFIIFLHFNYDFVIVMLLLRFARAYAALTNQVDIIIDYDNVS